LESAENSVLPSGPAARPSALLQNQNPSLITALIFGAVLLISSAWSLWSETTQTPTIDFLTFWSVPQALSKQNIANIYSQEGQHDLASVTADRARSPFVSDLQKRTTAIVLQVYNGRIDATASPLLYAAVGLLSSGNYITDQKRFLFVSMTCLVLSVLLLSRLFRLSALEIIILLTFLFWNYEPLLSDFRVGNVNQLQLLAIVLFIFLTARSRPLLAGMVIGVATTFKPTTFMVLALALLAALADREYKNLLRMILGGVTAVAVSVVLSALYFGNPAMWPDFLRSLPKTLNGTSYSLESGNFSFATQIFGPTSSRSLIIPIVLLLVFSWLLFATRRSCAAPSDSSSNRAHARFRFHTAFCVGGAGCAIMLLSSPLVWLHYYLSLLPLSLYVIHRPGADTTVGSAEISPARNFLSLGLPYVPLLVFSLLFHMFVGANFKLLFIFIVLATISTLVLAAYNIWHQRRTLNLLASTT
jgi:Uncharacterized conserved protein